MPPRGGSRDAVSVVNVFAPDEPAPSLPLEDALANAPEREGDFFRVPAEG